MRLSAALALIVSAAAVPSCASAVRHSSATITRGPRTAPVTETSGSAAPPETTVVAAIEPSPPPTTTSDPWATAPALETIEGRVSYYHDSLAGHATASGEPYDPSALTCASRDLPFGTLIRIVRPDTGASVVVRVNDRGPWGRRHPRILDLSRAAAEAIDMIRAGVIEVRAEIVRRGE
ncbi:MAG: septal ring lytic transglycosylase RlpA family protein [Sandaracinus sp.]